MNSADRTGPNAGQAGDDWGEFVVGERGIGELLDGGDAVVDGVQVGGELGDDDGLAGLACAACCAIPLLLAAAGAWMPGIAVALVALAGGAWWWVARRRHGGGCAGGTSCACSTGP